MPEYLIRWEEDADSDVAPYWSFDAETGAQAKAHVEYVEIDQGRKCETLFVEVAND